MGKITQTFTRLVQTGTTSATIVLPNGSTIVCASICYGGVNAPGGSSAVAIAEMRFKSTVGYDAVNTLTDVICALACGVPVAAATTDSLASSQYVEKNCSIPVPSGVNLLCQISSVATGYSVYFQVTVEVG